MSHERIVGTIRNKRFIPCGTVGVPDTNYLEIYFGFVFIFYFFFQASIIRGSDVTVRTSRRCCMECRC